MSITATLDREDGEMHFTSTEDKAGLSCETAHGAYWIWTDGEGNVTREVNCQSVEDFPANARKARQMEELFGSLQNRMQMYLTTSDSAQARDLWWRIRKTVQAV
ncbi:MAG: hypothetical protein ABIG63_17545 [Chloroflexota bacterium]